MPGPILSCTISHILPSLICTSPRLSSLLCTLIRRLSRGFEVLIPLCPRRWRRRSSIARRGRFGRWWKLRSHIGPWIPPLIAPRLISRSWPDAVRIVLCSLVYIYENLVCRLDLLKFGCHFAFATWISVGMVRQGWGLWLADIASHGCWESHTKLLKLLLNLCKICGGKDTKIIIVIPRKVRLDHDGEVAP